MKGKWNIVTKGFNLFLKVVFVWIISNNLNAQTDTDYTRQYQLINQIKKYLIDSTAYAIDTSAFYANYNSVLKGTFYYVYVSEKIKPQSPFQLSVFKYFGLDSAAAYTYAQEQIANNYDVYVYQTAGTSAAQINTELLNYFNEEIAFILFHEATHQYIEKFNPELPYGYVEALCDAASINLLNRFAANNSTLFNNEAVKNFTLAINNIHSAIVSSLITLKEKPKRVEKTFDNLQKQLTEFCRYSNFLQKRYAMPINMAWMLRNKYYSGFYYYCKMFVWFPNTKIMTLQLSKVFSPERNTFFQYNWEKELFIEPK